MVVAEKLEFHNYGFCVIFMEIIGGASFVRLINCGPNGVVMLKYRFHGIANAKKQH